MKGAETKALEKLFDAKLEPIATGVSEIKSEQKKHGEKITKLETKFEYIGNCSDHTAKVDNVVDEVAKQGKRQWGLVIALLVSAIGIIAKYVIG